MAYIYQITNDINGKIYIGKTEFSIEKRFKEHCKDAFRERCEKRPLYAAMRKYGIEHFHIELIEETDNPEEREMFWIEEKSSFKQGYNATKGGDGRRYVDYDLVIATYKKVGTIKQTATLLQLSEKTVANIVKKNIKNTPIRGQYSKENYSIMVGMYNKKTKQLEKVFSSYSEAGQWLIDQKLSNCKLSTIRTHISEVCNQKRKTAAGYIWKKIED